MRRRTAYSRLAPDVEFVSIYCDGRKDEPHDRWLISTFYPEHDPTVEGEWLWMEAVGQYWRSDGEVVHVAGRAAARLVGDRPVSGDEARANPAVFEQGDSRTRYNLPCQTCGLALVIKGRKFQDQVLWKLVAASAREVSLAGVKYMLKPDAPPRVAPRGSTA